MGRKKVTTTIYITPEQEVQLKLLNERTKVPVAEYIRQGIDLILYKYRDQLPGQVALPFGGPPSASSSPSPGPPSNPEPPKPPEWLK